VAARCESKMLGHWGQANDNKEIQEIKKEEIKS
jgi:hypothetical protein